MYLVCISNPAEPNDRIVADFTNKQSAERFVREANDRIIADHGVPKRGNPLPLYYLVRNAKSSRNQQRASGT